MAPSLAKRQLRRDLRPPRTLVTHSLKHELTNHERFANLEEARLSVFRYIETLYNSERIHETLDYLTPDAYEAENAPAVAA